MDKILGKYKTNSKFLQTIMRKYFSILMFILPLCLLQAQNEKPKGFFRKIGHLLNDIDTLYISPNKYNFAFMLENSNWYKTIVLGLSEKKFHKR